VAWLKRSAAVPTLAGKLLFAVSLQPPHPPPCPRPAVFPPTCPFEFQLLAVRCWESDPSIRPTFDQIIHELKRMQRRLAPCGAKLVSADPAAAAAAAALGAPAESLQARLVPMILEEAAVGSTAAYGSGAAGISLASGLEPETRQADSTLVVVPMVRGGPMGGGAAGGAAAAAAAAPASPSPRTEPATGVSGASFEPSDSSYSLWRPGQVLEAVTQQRAAAAAAAAAASGEERVSPDAGEQQQRDGPSRPPPARESSLSRARPLPTVAAAGDEPAAAAPSSSNT
jgi:hypothetical protein